MEQRGETVVETETEASGGSKEGVVRWVLIIGLLLAVAFLTLIWVTGALSQGDVEEEATASGIAASQSENRGEPIAPDFQQKQAASSDMGGSVDGASENAATQEQ